MDMFNDFVATIGRVRFTAFSELRDAVENFNERADTKFRIFRSHKLPAGHQHGDTVIYRSVHYACRYNNSEGCSASFLISYFNGYLICKHMNLAHNHMSLTAREISNSLPSDYNIVSDLTEDFKRKFPCRIFASFRELISRLNEYEQETGSVFVKKHVKHWEAESGHRSTLVYKTLAFHCIHHGHPSSIARTFAFGGSLKMGCRAKLYVSSMSGQVRIKSINLRHNHEVSQQLASTYNRNLRFSSVKQNLIESLSTTNLAPGRICDLLMKKSRRSVTPQAMRKMVYRARRHFSSGSRERGLQKEQACADANTSEKCTDGKWHDSDDTCFASQRSSLPLLCMTSEICASEGNTRPLLHDSHVKADFELQYELTVNHEYENKTLESVSGQCSVPDTSASNSSSTPGASLDWIARHEICTTCAVTPDLQTRTEALDNRCSSTGVVVGPPPSSSSEMRLAHVLREATFEDIFKEAGPKLAQCMPLWKFFQLRCQYGGSSSTHIPALVDEYLHLVKQVQLFLTDHLKPLAANAEASSSRNRRPLAVFPTAVPSDTPALKKPRLEYRMKPAAGSIGAPSVGFDPPSPSVHDDESVGRLHERMDSPTDSPADVVIETAEQSTALGLPIDRYVLRRPTASIRLHSPLLKEITVGRQCQPHVSMPEETVLRLADIDCRTNHSPPSPPKLSCHYQLCDEGLGEAIPPELIASGVFLPYLPKADSSSDLVMEVASGRIFHRLSGRLVIPVSQPPVTSTDSSVSTDCDGRADTGNCVLEKQEEEVEVEEEEDLAEIGSPIIIEAPPGADDETYTSIAADVAARRVALESDAAATTTQLTLMRLPTCPTASLVIRPDGAIFRVEHGDEGVTKASMKAILRFRS